jgi:hypothetical protein
MEQTAMKVEPNVDKIDFDDDVSRVAILARKATRKAARAANKAGYFVEHAAGKCIIRSPEHTVEVTVKSTHIDVRKRYTFANATH